MKITLDEKLVASLVREFLVAAKEDAMRRKEISRMCEVDSLYPERDLDSMTDLLEDCEKRPLQTKQEIEEFLGEVGRRLSCGEYGGTGFYLYRALKACDG